MALSPLYIATSLTRWRRHGLVGLLLILILAVTLSHGVGQTPTTRPHQPPAKLPAPKAVTTFERSGGSATVSPDKVIAWYRKLASQSPYIRVQQVGVGDAGDPIHLVVLAKKLPQHPKQRDNRVVVLINNGIHSGESCGIDATQMLFRDVAAAMKTFSTYDSLVILAIPIYNVGGHKQFHPYNRVNQNGPVQMGFRGNARNYDLNRDFIKTDSANMRTMARIFRQWRPHLFVDNHSTNGADYQHAMTYMLSDLPNMSPPLQHVAKMKLRPALEAMMKKRGFPLAPYVILHKRGEIKQGLIRAFSTPRYSTGFAPLFNTIAILAEAHMLKPYKIRVKATYAMNQSLLRLASQFAEELRTAQRMADQEASELRRYALKWKRNHRIHSKITFLGYAYQQILSPVMGSLILRYDTTKPRTWQIPYYDRYRPVLTVKVPKAYIIPQQWRRVIQRLRWNGVKMKALPKAQEFEVTQTIFSHIKWSKRPYEGHFPAIDMKLETISRRVRYQKGDWVISTRQPAARYIVETLEPMGHDSFVRWNFFDTIFQQKEYFDPYLFAPLAEKMLRQDKRLRQIFTNRLRKEPAFANNPYQRLQFLYQSSRYYEAVHNVYPITRIP